MSNKNRISLLIIANLLVPAVFFMALSLLDICFFSPSNELDYTAFTVFCLLSAMGMALLSFALSKVLPKRISATRATMPNRNRIVLLVVTNLLVPVAFFSALDLLDISLYSNTKEIDYNALTVFCLLSAMGIGLLSLALSKMIPKQTSGIRVIKPRQASSTETICHIVLARHGETDWNDISLNAEGRNQAKQLAEILSSIPVKAIYTTPFLDL